MSGIRAANYTNNAFSTHNLALHTNLLYRRPYFHLPLQSLKQNLFRLLNVFTLATNEKPIPQNSIPSLTLSELALSPKTDKKTVGT
jgi:hypothetical protein